MSESARSQHSSSSRTFTKPTKHRKRSSTASSSQTSTHTEEVPKLPKSPHRTLFIKTSETGSATPTRRSVSDASRNEQSTPEPVPIRKISSGASLSATRPSQATPTTPGLTPVIAGATDDSDTDFQSAYSASPRGSYGSLESTRGFPHVKGDETAVGIVNDLPDDFGKPVPVFSKHRERNDSAATTTHFQPKLSPTLSQDTESLPSEASEELN